MEAIRLEEFSCFYKWKKERIVALNNVSFSVEEGTLLAVVGQSGSGKTTLLKSLLDLSEFTQGSIFLFGRPIEDANVTEENMAYVRQEIVLYPHLNVYDNIAFPLRSQKLPHKEVDPKVRKIAEELQLGWLLTRKPQQLSKGQQQRIALAKALVKDPKIILFDEPFAALDPALRNQMRELVKKYHQNTNITMIFVTHDLDEAVNLADQILVLQDGAVEALGTPEELRRRRTSQLMNIYFDEQRFK